MIDSDSEGAGRLVDLLALCAAALALRLFAHYAAPNIIWADEVFQVTEPAHRVLFGTSVLAFEWVAGLHSWLFPGVVLGLMALGRQFGSDPMVIQFPVILFMAVASCLPVMCGYGWGRQFYGRLGGIVAGAVNVVWVDLIYFSTHTLNDVISGDCLVACLYVGCPRVPTRSPRRLVAFGLLVGLTFDLRVQLAPALAMAVVCVCFGRGWVRHGRLVLVGAAIPLLALGALDWVTLGAPWQSVYGYTRMAAVLALDPRFGHDPVYGYVSLLLGRWSSLAPLIGLCAFVGARRLKPVAAVAVVVFATFSLIPHKEPRYIYPGLVLLISFVGLATAQLVTRLAALNLPNYSDPRGIARLAILFWAGTSLLLAKSPAYQEIWAYRRQYVEAFEALSNLPGLCGVGLYGVPWVETPGNGGLPPTVELDETTTATLAHDADGFNAILANEGMSIADDRFRRLDCFANGADRGGSVCVWHREGGCVAGRASPPPINWPNGQAP